MMGTMQFYILAFLFVILMGFVYFLVGLFLSNIKELTQVLSELKAFSMGKSEVTKEPEKPRPVIFPDEDFGDLRPEEEKPEDELD